MPKNKEELSALELKWLYLSLAAAFIGNKNDFKEAFNPTLIDKIFAARENSIKDLAGKLEELNAAETGKSKQRGTKAKAAMKEAEKIILEIEQEAFNRSRYMQAMDALSDIKYKSEIENPEEAISSKDFAVIYFFTIHEELNPMTPDGLTKEEITEIRDIFQRLTIFFEEKQFTDGADAIQILNAFIEFAKKDSEHIAKLKNQDITKIIKQKITEIEYPLDKVNTKIWGLMPNGETIALKAETDSDSSAGKQASTYLTLDLDEIEGAELMTSRPLTAYDKRVFISVANLVEQGQDILTTTQIYKAMGNNSRPSAADREKILKSLEFLSTIKIHIDNSEEAKLYSRYERIKGSFYLLATEYKAGCTANGHIVEDAIHVIKYPDLFAFSKKRRQITKIPAALLESPLSQSEANLQLEDYLLRRIAQMKNHPERTHIILLETIYENCNITNRLQKSRLPEKITRILDHCKKSDNWIKSYTIDSKRIKITL